MLIALAAALLLQTIPAPPDEPRPDATESEWEAFDEEYRAWDEATRPARDAAHREAAARVEREMEKSCRTLDACLELFGGSEPLAYFGDIRSAFTAALARFGRPARDALVEVARGRGMHASEAGSILQAWPDWTDDDLPLFRDWVADDPLDRTPYQIVSGMRSDAAFRLILDAHDGGGLWDSAEWLVAYGETAAHLMLGRLEQAAALDDQVARGRAASVLLAFDVAPESFVEQLAAQASAPNRPESTRIAALWALDAMGDASARAEAEIVAIARSSGGRLRRAALNALASMGSTELMADYAELCPIETDAFERSYYLRTDCPDWLLGQHPEAAVGAAPVLAEALASPNIDQRVDTIRLLGQIGWREGAPLIRPFLHSPHVTEVDAAVVALWRLEDRGSADEISRLAVTHWWPTQRRRADFVGRVLSGAPVSPEEVQEFERRNMYRLNHPARACPSARWRYNGIDIPPLENLSDAIYAQHGGADAVLRVARRGGQLTGTDGGDWGGDLAWRPDSGAVAEFIEENLRALTAHGESALALIGYAHMGADEGRVIRLDPDGSGGWRLSLVAILPGAPYAGLAHIEGPLYAAGDEGWAVVFHAEAGIVGLADCVIE